MLNGYYITYHKDHRIKSETNYKNGNLHGTSREWDENDKLILETNYKDNLPHGRCIMYDECNKSYTLSMYSNGTIESIEFDVDLKNI